MPDKDNGKMMNERIKLIKKNGTNSALREEWHATADGAQVLILKYPLLEETGMVKHCFTTRLGGVSEGMFSTMNLSFSRGDDSAAVETNYRRLAEVMDVSYEKFVFTDQTHTVNVRKETAKDAGCGIVRDRDYHDIDGLITNEPGLVLSTFFADCVPLYFVDPVHKAIGMSHSGWRGTATRMGKVTLEAMNHEYGSRPEDMICAIGPSICQDCYEISADVAEAFAREFRGHEKEILTESLKNRTIEAADEKKYHLNLWRANEIVLIQAGVKKEHIAVTDVCTCCNSEVLFSHRASHGKRGNLGGFLCIK